MGGAGKKIRQAGRWFDKEVLQSKAAGVVSPFVMGYQAYSGTGWFDSGAKAAEINAPPPGPDASDRAIQAARDAERKRLLAGSRRNSFIGGDPGAAGSALKAGGR